MINYPEGRQPKEIDIADPEKRRVIMVLPGSEIDEIRYGSYKHKEDLSKPGIWLVEDTPELYSQNNQVFLQSLKEQKLLRNGNILIQSAKNPSHYVKADEVTDKIVKPKWSHFAVVCFHLGAKNWKINTSTEINSMTTNGFKIDIFSIVQKLNFLGNNYRKEVVKEVKEIIVEATGSEPNIDEAKRYINEHHLNEDENIVAIREFRNNNVGNKILKFKYRVNLLKEVDSNLELAASLRLPQSAIKILPQFNRYVKKFQKFSTDIEVTFPKPIPKDF